MYKKNVNNSQNQAPVRMKRKAIDGSGHIGSFYDGYFDSIFGEINMDDKGQIEERDEPVSCKILHGNADKNQDLLQMVGIEDNLRLNILLGIAPQIRVASIIQYPYPINQYTRFIHFTYEHRKQYLPEDVAEVQKIIGSFQPRTTATHIITSVHYGIEAVIILRLSSDDVNINQIDDALRRVQENLHDNPDRSCLTSYDENLFRQNTEILVYSNISVLNTMTSLRDIYQFLNKRNTNKRPFQPLSYILTPIHQIYPQFIGSSLPFIQLESTYQNKLEQSLVQSFNILKDFKHSLDYKLTRLLRGHLKERLSKLQQEWVNLKDMQEREIKRLKKLMYNIRRSQHKMSLTDKAITNEDQVIFYGNIDRMTQGLHELEEKGQLITDLTQAHFQYCNVVDYDIDQNDNETTIEHKLISNNQNALVLCSNDILNENHSQQFQTLCEDLIKNRERHSDLQLIYADFSYSSFKLKNMLVLPSSTHRETSSSKETSMASLNTDMINILLLGETGVGKSTFINAFANYLTFNTMQEAETNQAVVLIPVSFLATVGDNFDEYIVKFGDVDDLNNEDFEHPGQSVTQHCRSYVFNVDHNHGKKVCIIDTPGFGDTRGIDQDDYNMTHILEYIKELSHLDAICFLLKPNESRLNIFFRSCFVQLFSLLGPNIADNILFCFTNSRSTFYAPGNTAPLLKKMLTSFSKNDIPFKKDNTFCFDSESFRYLVALRNNIPFSDLERRDYEASWSNSVTQSKRLIDCIHTKLTAYRIAGNLHSVKHAQLEILHMIRPMLEAMRNILRNRIIQTMIRSNETFEMYPKAISRPTTICISCKPNPLQVGHFWVAHNIPHEIQNNCNTCQCSLDKHHSIDYILDYECSNNSSKYDHHRIDDLLHELCQASAVFAHFLTNTNGSSKDEPFFTGLVQMINEEKDLCDAKKPNDLNLRLVDDLRRLQTEYDKRINSIICNQTNSILADIYQLINTVREYPMVREQIIAAKEGQQMITKQFEYEISENI